MHNILVVDDDRRMVNTLQRALTTDSVHITGTTSGMEALGLVRQSSFDLVITDLLMPEVDGLAVTRGIHNIDPTVPIIVLTGNGSIDSAVEAMRAGAFDYLLKPIRMPELRLIAGRALESREVIVENKNLRERLKAFVAKDLIIGKSPRMRELLTTMEQVAPSTATVLITGDTGTGKELVADTLHNLSPRADAALVKVNCGALPESLIESELFGHVKGSFTGAVRDHTGRFELANGGTLFLDEIGEMSPPSQVRLLRVLQEGIFERVGGTKPTQVDVRVVAATNQNLVDLVKQGLFREDLYYRIHVICLHLPPLRERREDVVLLANHFMRRYAERNSKDIRGIGEEALARLQAYNWPGNIRELENAIEHGVVLAKGDRITVEDLPTHVRDKQPLSPRGDIAIPLGWSLDRAEAEIIRETLERFGGDKEAAANILGCSERTLYRKLREHRRLREHGDTVATL